MSASAAATGAARAARPAPANVHDPRRHAGLEHDAGDAGGHLDRGPHAVHARRRRPPAPFTVARHSAGRYFTCATSSAGRSHATRASTRAGRTDVATVPRPARGRQPLERTSRRAVTVVGSAGAPRRSARTPVARNTNGLASSHSQSLTPRSSAATRRRPEVSHATPGAVVRKTPLFCSTSVAAPVGKPAGTANQLHASLSAWRARSGSSSTAREGVSSQTAVPPSAGICETQACRPVRHGDPEAARDVLGRELHRLDAGEDLSRNDSQGQAARAGSARRDAPSRGRARATPAGRRRRPPRAARRSGARAGTRRPARRRCPAWRRRPGGMAPSRPATRSEAAAAVRGIGGCSPVSAAGANGRRCAAPGRSDAAVRTQAAHPAAAAGSPRGSRSINARVP